MRNEKALWFRQDSFHILILANMLSDLQFFLFYSTNHSEILAVLNNFLFYYRNTKHLPSLRPINKKCNIMLVIQDK